jgi:hypothetical protein
MSQYGWQHVFQSGSNNKPTVTSRPLDEFDEEIIGRNGKVSYFNTPLIYKIIHSQPWKRNYC